MPNSQSDLFIKSIYTDGACSGNPGVGGWGVVVYFTDGSIHEIGGAAAQTTNNRMEMQAAISALEFLLVSKPSESVALYTDSEYLKNGITQWIKGWKRKGWKTSTGKPVLNQDLWMRLDELMEQVNQVKIPLHWEHVRGHAGNEGNERCDAIARNFATGRIPALQVASPNNSLSSLSHETKISSDSILSATSSILPEIVGSASVVSDRPMEVSLPAPTTESGVMDAMNDANSSPLLDALDDLPREVRVTQLRHVVETLRIADEIASQGYLITSSELADLMDVNAGAVTSRGDNWVWRNWVVSRVRREGNQILWQLERVD
jgi:ribonuclease HI